MTEPHRPPSVPRSSAPPGAPASPGLPPISPAFLAIGLGRILRTEVEAELARVGFSLRHLSALGHLAAQPGLSYSELARRGGVTVQSMQSTLRQLEGIKAVKRLTPSGRGRRAELQITSTGAALLEQGRQTITRADRRLLADLPTEQHRAFTAALLQAFTAGVKRTEH